jgi:hypothetical protein
MADEELKAAKRSRSAHRGQMTKQLEKANAIVLSDDTPPSQNNLDILNATVKDISLRMSKVLTLDEKIVSLTPPTGFDAAFVDADDYSIYINEHSSKYQSFLDRSSTTPSADTSLISSHTSTARKVNLPKLSLTNFAGDILQWQGFKDSFDAAVHSDDSLGNIQKFQYLRKHVEGEAARAIEGLSLTNANYEDAIDILTKRYGQPHKVNSAYMTALWKLEEPSGSIASLLSFHDSVESYIRGLKTLEKNEDTFGDLLVPIIIEKLPASTRCQIARDNGDDAWTIAKLRTAIRKEIEAMQAGQSALHEIPDTPATAAFVATTHPRTQRQSTPKQPRGQPKCAFCKNSHRSVDCNIVKGTEKRKEIVKRDRLCYNCLGPHRASDCTSKFRCKNCKQKHHTTICDAETTQDKPNEVKGLSCVTPVTVNHVHPGSPVLLKTAG